MYSGVVIHRVVVVHDEEVGIFLGNKGKPLEEAGSKRRERLSEGVDEQGRGEPMR